jgi:hypothetical protein
VSLREFRSSAGIVAQAELLARRYRIDSVVDSGRERRAHGHTSW